MRLTTERGAELEVTSRADLERALAGVGREGNGFAVLSRSADAFMQTAATAPGAFVVERRDGPRGSLLRSERADLSRSEVLRLFASYLEGTGTFRDAVVWTEAEPPPLRRRADALSLDPGPAGDRTARRMIALVVVGLGLAAASLWLASRDRAFLARAVQAAGTVVSFEVTTSGKRSSKTYWPVLRFDGPDGQPRTFRGDVGSPTPEYRVGQRLAVLYDPADPDDARIAGPVAVSPQTLLAGLVGALLAVAGAGGLLLRRR